MSLLSVFERDQDKEAIRQLAEMIQPGQYVGDVYSLSYETALVQIHDYYRRRVGGIPSLCFLVATRLQPDDEEIDYQEEDTSIILLRVMDGAPLPSHSEAERVRVEVAQKVAGDVRINWDSHVHMDAATHQLLSFAGVKCRVIGTFFVDASERSKKPTLRFGSDLSNYYPNQGLKVYKPNQTALEYIVNYIDVDRIDDRYTSERVRIGEVRYASTHRSFQGVSEVPVFVSPADLLGQKTALFGMTRTGKSNTTKIILQSVFELRYATDKPLRMGQLVFDPNGEYANENIQDVNSQMNPSAIKNVWQTDKRGNRDDVVTYGITPHKRDPERKLMLLNFYDDGNLQIGKEIIDDALAGETSSYIQNFRQVQFETPSDSDVPRGDSEASKEYYRLKTRFDRRVLAYRALLAHAGFGAPANLKPKTKGLLNPNLLEAMRNSPGTNKSDYLSAATILSKENATWEQIALALKYLEDFIDKAENSGYKKFNEDYISNGGESGEQWADEGLLKILKMFHYYNGPRLIGKVATQHTNQTNGDYAADIYQQLQKGKLVIVDQSSGDSAINKVSADRIMHRIFTGQQQLFRSAKSSLPEILIYVEEAHNLLPAGSEQNYKDIWVRTAKEGAKYHIGLVYATQEVSSIQKNILKNTANWFIGHLNNTDETKELCKYYDFADFEQSIRRAQDRGFLRVKTLSNLFVIPVQVRKFEV